MADGANYMNVLHTNPLKFAGNWEFKGITDIKDSFVVTDIKNRISKLENQEHKLYSKYGCADFYEFMEHIHQLLDNPTYQVEIDCLKQFSMSNLRPILLNRFKGEESGNRPNTPSFSLQVNQQQSKKIEFNFNGEKTEISTPRTDLKELRGFLHENFGTRANLGKSKILPTIISHIKEGHLIFEGEGGATIDSLRFNIDIGTKVWPWGYTATEYKQIMSTIDANNLDNQIMQEALHRALKEIENFIVNEMCSGAPVVQAIARRHINKLFSTTSSIEQSAMFFQGGNFINGVGGALGELQTAMTFDFLAEIERGSGQLISEVIGDIVNKNGQKPKTDVQLFDEINVQVKNYSFNRKDTIINTSTTPEKISEYLTGEQGLSLRGFLANWYFSKDFRTMYSGKLEKIEQFLYNEIEGLFSLAVKDGMEDNISFYFISGGYLVPGSHILKAVLFQHPPVTITGKESDVHVETNDNYWSKDESSGQWEPTPKNTEKFDEYVNRTIAIRTNFDYDSFMSQVYALI